MSTEYRIDNPVTVWDVKFTKSVDGTCEPLGIGRRRYTKRNWNPFWWHRWPAPPPSLPSKLTIALPPENARRRCINSQTIGANYDGPAIRDRITRNRSVFSCLFFSLLRNNRLDLNAETTPPSLHTYTHTQDAWKTRRSFNKITRPEKRRVFRL